MILHVQQLNQLNKCFNLNIKIKKKETKVKLLLFIAKKDNKFLIKNEIKINNKPLDVYFNKNEVQRIVKILLFSTLYKDYYFNLIVFVKGGGLLNQATTLILSLKLLLKKSKNLYNSIFFKNMAKNYVRIDYRKKERKKYGLKKARKASQYHKR